MNSFEERLRETLYTEAQDLADGSADRVLALVASRQSGQQRRPRRRRGAVVASAVLATAAVVVGAQLLVPNGSDRREPPPIEAPDGMRLVGLGRAVVAVPEEWGTQDAECGWPVRDTVYAVDADGTSCSVSSSDSDTGRPPENYESLSWVRLVAATGSNGSRLFEGLDPAAPVDGVDVVESGTCNTNADDPCDLTVAVPSQAATFEIHAPASLALQIRASLRMLPAGQTTVPFVPDPAYDDAEKLMVQAGLRTRTEPAPTSRVPAGAVPESYLYSDPPAGTPVRDGAEVVLRVVPGTLDDLNDQEYPDADDIQGDWTMGLSGLGIDGVGHVEPRRDLTMTMHVEGDQFTATVGCATVAGRFTLVNRAWSAADVATTGAGCQPELPPVGELIASTKHATISDGQWTLMGSNYGIVLFFDPQ